MSETAAHAVAREPTGQQNDRQEPDREKYERVTTRPEREHEAIQENEVRGFGSGRVRRLAAGDGMA